MKKLFCSCSPGSIFERHELAPDLFATHDPALFGKQCPSCHAVLLSLKDYRNWREHHFSEIPTAEPALTPGQEKPSKARTCPACRHLMERYRTGSEESFWLDFCLECQLVWLDEGEWEQLEKSGLALHLDIILTGRWQRLIRERKALPFREEGLVRRFGDALSEIERVRSWLDAQPNKRDILAYWTAHSGKRPI
jgi:hypothetical protein